MGTVFRRGDSRFWWIGFYDSTGKRHLVSSQTEDEAIARKLLASVERKVEAEVESGLVVDKGVITVGKYARRWIHERRSRGVRTVGDDEDRLAHALPELESMRLEEVRPRHLRDLVRDLVASGEQRRKRAKPGISYRLAPRTIRHVYATLRVMFADAVRDELLVASPCVLSERRGELPKKRDKDPAWRATAVFARDEVESLISDRRIPSFRRVLYSVLFLAGCRINEVTPRQWRNWDPGVKPLGRLSVVSHYDAKAKVEIVGTKGGQPARDVPVHPTLATVLARWKMGGWQDHLGRAPRAEDLIIPAPNGKTLNSSTCLTWFHEDLQLLGLRARRQHDARRTFISLGIADGARKEILRWVSHGPEGDIIDAYTTLPWATLCDEVGKLRLRVLEGNVVPLVAARGYVAATDDERG